MSCGTGRGGEGFTTGNPKVAFVIRMASSTAGEYGVGGR
jgi:hypothetical protein